METIARCEQYNPFHSSAERTGCNLCRKSCTRPSCIEDSVGKPCKVKLTTPVYSAMDRPINISTGLQLQNSYQDTIIKNLNRIGDHERCGMNSRIINRQMNHRFSYQDLQNTLRDILYEQDGAIQANIGFGFILQNTVTKEFKYFFDSRNHMLYERPVTINCEEDLFQFTREVATFDLAKKYYLDMTPSIWVVAGFTNVELHVSSIKGRTSSPIPVQLNVVPAKGRKSNGGQKFLFLIVGDDQTNSSDDRMDAGACLLQKSTLCSHIEWCDNMSII